MLVAVAACVAYFTSRGRDTNSAVEREVTTLDNATFMPTELIASPPAERAAALPAVKEEEVFAAAPAKPAVERTANVTIRLLSNGEPMREGRVVLRTFDGVRLARDVDATTGEARFTDLKPMNYDVAVESIPEGWLITRALANDHKRGYGVRIYAELGENRLDLEFEPGAIVRGIVHDENGWPESDARVHIYSLHPRERSVRSRFVDVTGGTFEVSVHAGASLIEVMNSSGQKRRVPPPVQVIDLAVGARADLEFRFERGTETFAGRVLDEVGAPFAGLQVGISRSQSVAQVAGARPLGGDWRQGLTGSKTDADGRFAFEGLPRGKCAVYIEEKGVSPFDRPADATVARIQNPRTVELPLTEPWQVTIERAHPVLVRGRVLIEKKGQVHSLEVVLPVGERRAKEHRESFNIGYDGAFKFHLDGAEADAAIELQHEGRVQRVPLALSTNSTELLVDVPLP